jgi:peroxiredoxin
MTGSPDNATPDGWDQIPGARGCTPQSCAFRDHHAELQALGAQVFGLSTQTTGYQREAVERLQLPFAILSDSGLELTSRLRLPTFEIETLPDDVGPTRLLKRLTMIVNEGHIEQVFYPVFPPDANAAQVVQWLRENPSDSGLSGA